MNIDKYVKDAVEKEFRNAQNDAVRHERIASALAQIVGPFDRAGLATDADLGHYGLTRLGHENAHELDDPLGTLEAVLADRARRSNSGAAGDRGHGMDAAEPRWLRDYLTPDAG